MPIGGADITGMDVYCAGKERLLLHHAVGHLSSEDLLDRVRPCWRSEQADRFDITTADDGEPIIRMRSDVEGA